MSTGAYILQDKQKEQLLYDLIAEWLHDYRCAETEREKAKAKALIVTRMLPIVKRIAHTIARRSYDPIDDLIQAGSIGLLKAIDSFSPERNNNFKFYAGSLIIGEMKHYLRDKLNTIKVPRHIQELSIRINSFISTLTPEELNELTNEYVADALNVPKKDIDFAIQAERRKTTISFEDLYPKDVHNLGYEEIIPYDNYKEMADIEDARLILGLVIARLPKEYRKIIELYYYQDLSQKEIAKKLELSEMQISRKIKKAFALLHQGSFHRAASDALFLPCSVSSQGSLRFSPLTVALLLR